MENAILEDQDIKKRFLESCSYDSRSWLKFVSFGSHIVTQFIDTH